MATGFSSPVLTVKCDITRREEVKALVARAREKFNTIDVLVNNAGIILPARFEESSYEDIDRQLNINLVGTINVTREVLPVLIENGGGNIVTISSMAGIVPETYSSIYTATKFALRGFNLTLALELKEYGIAVSTIFPDSTRYANAALRSRSRRVAPYLFKYAPEPGEGGGSGAARHYREKAGAVRASFHGVGLENINVCAGTGP